MIKPKLKTGFAVGDRARIAGRKGGLKSKGRKLTEEHKQKLREAHLRRNKLVERALGSEDD